MYLRNPWAGNAYGSLAKALKLIWWSDDHTRLYAVSFCISYEKRYAVSSIEKTVSIVVGGA